MKRRARKPRKAGRAGSTFLPKAALLALSLLLLPFSGSLILNFGRLFSRYSGPTSGMLLASGGVGSCFLLFLAFGPPARSYIFAHEISHAFFALLSGVRVKRVSVTGSEGSVETARVNLLIALGPYAFPLYALLVFLVYSAVSLFLKSPAVKTLLGALFHFSFGFALAFHLLSTLHYVQIDQPDLKRYGYLASLIIIFTLTVAVTALMLGLGFAKTELFVYFVSAWRQTVAFYARVLGLISG